MKQRLILVGCLAVAISLLLLALPEKTMSNYGIGGSGIRSAIGNCFAAGLTLLVIALLGPAKAEVETFASLRAHKRFEAAEVVRARIRPAMRGIDHLQSVGLASPERLPELTADAFNSVAQFCSGWQAAERNYWTADEHSSLLEANRAVFEFLLTLELQRAPSKRDLDEKAQIAHAALQAAINKLDLGS